MIDADTHNALDRIMQYMQAENEAFEKAGIKTGKIEFICPLCGGKAIGNRYEHSGRTHGLGSGCTKCGITHS